MNSILNKSSNNCAKSEGNSCSKPQNWCVQQEFYDEKEGKNNFSNEFNQYYEKQNNSVNGD